MGQSRMDNPETLATLGTQDTDEDNPETLTTLGTQDTGRRQSRDTDNIGHTRHRTKTIQRHWQHWAHKTQDEDKQNKKHNTEN